MTWLLFSLVAYALYAVVTIIDKYLLDQSIPSPKVYAFYVGVLGLFSLMLTPLGFEIPEYKYIVLNLITGAIFIFSLFIFFSALKLGEASRVGVSLGAFVPIFTLFFIFIFFGGESFLGLTQIVAFGLLVFGSLILIFGKIKKTVHGGRIFTLILVSTLFYGLYFALAKVLFTAQPFISAFIWIKIGAFVTSMFFLFSPSVRSIIRQHKASSSKKTTASIFVVKNIAGGIAALFQNYAVALAKVGEVPIVNALQGVQYVFVILIALFLTKKFPRILKEEMEGPVLIIKMLGTILVVSGVALLAFGI